MIAVWLYASSIGNGTKVIEHHISWVYHSLLLQIWDCDWEPVSESICCWEYNLKYILPCGLRTCEDCRERQGEALQHNSQHKKWWKSWGFTIRGSAFHWQPVLLLSLGFRKDTVLSMHRLVCWFLSVCPLISSLCHPLSCTLGTGSEIVIIQNPLPWQPHPVTLWFHLWALFCWTEFSILLCSSIK